MGVTLQRLLSTGNKTRTRTHTLDWHAPHIAMSPWGTLFTLLVLTFLTYKLGACWLRLPPGLITSEITDTIFICKYVNYKSIHTFTEASGPARATGCPFLKRLCSGLSHWLTMHVHTHAHTHACARLPFETFIKG